jgi:hypothetical protein
VLHDPQLVKYEAELGIKMIDLLDEEADTSRLKDVLPEQTKAIAALFENLRTGQNQSSIRPEPQDLDRSDAVDSGVIEQKAEQREVTVLQSDAPRTECDDEEQLYLRWRAEAGLH